MITMPAMTTMTCVVVAAVILMVGLVVAAMRLVCRVVVVRVVAGVLVRFGLGGPVVGLLVVHALSVPSCPVRVSQEAGWISLSTTHLWLVIFIPSAS